MTKHIAGLILFSFIVGTSVFVAAITGSERTVDVQTNYYRTFKKKKRKRKRRRCRPHRHDVESKLEAATFNRESGLLATSFSKFGHHRMSKDVELHFFAKDRYGTRFLKTEYLGTVGSGIERFKEMNWLKRIDEGQNIYVLAKSNDAHRAWSFPPKFDASDAVLVEFDD